MWQTSNMGLHYNFIIHLRSTHEYLGGKIVNYVLHHDNPSVYSSKIIKTSVPTVQQCRPLNDETDNDAKLEYWCYKEKKENLPHISQLLSVVRSLRIREIKIGKSTVRSKGWWLRHVKSGNDLVRIQVDGSYSPSLTALALLCFGKKERACRLLVAGATSSDGQTHYVDPW